MNNYEANWLNIIGLLKPLKKALIFPSRLKPTLALSQGFQPLAD
jgi:hypothetical protein